MYSLISNCFFIILGCSTFSDCIQMMLIRNGLSLIVCITNDMLRQIMRS